MIRYYRYFKLLIIFLFSCSFIIYVSIVKNYKNKSIEFVNSVSLINNKENAAEAEGEKSESIEDFQENSSLLKRGRELLSISWKRDPFSLKSLIKNDKNPSLSFSLDAAAKKSSEKRYKNKGSLGLELTGIIYFDNQYIALINDMSFKEGDTISDFKVNKIMRNRVILKDDTGEHYTMEFE